MISNQVLQTTIDGLRSIARVELCVVDVDGKMIATTSEEMSNCLGAAQDFSRSPADSQEVQGYQFFKILDETAGIYPCYRRRRRRCLYDRQDGRVPDTESFGGI